jgi:pyruvate dehydrogenase (quinone)
MANALPHAIGVQASHPGRQVVTMSGDGGLAMLLGELITLRQQRLPVKIVVFNNGALGFVELEQKSTGFINIGTDFVNPNFAMMAEAVGIKGVRIEDPAEVEGKLAEALAHPGAVVVDAVVNRNELAMPPKITAQMVKGFSLYMLRVVLSGRTDELIELARTNVRR